MYDFDYHRPQASPMPRRRWAAPRTASCVAGGMTLIPTLKQRLAKPSDLVDLGGIAELKGIKSEGNAIVIGAMTRHADVADLRRGQEAPSRRWPISPSMIGDPQVRNRGTIGGSIANNDPAADYPAAVVGARRDGHHQQAQDRRRRFLQGPVRDGARADGEIITAVSFPIAEKAAYDEVPATRPRATPWSACSSPRPASGVRVAVTGAGPCVFRQKEMEAALAKSFTPDAIDRTSSKAPNGLNADIHASAEYRAHLVTVMAKRAVQQATG